MVKGYWVSGPVTVCTLAYGRRYKLDHFLLVSPKLTSHIKNSSSHLLHSSVND